MLQLVLGNAETYLVKDVPNFMQANFNAAIGKHSLAVAGLSDGGTCASMLALRNPQVFQTFGDYSGYASPTYLNDNEQQTIAQLYGGSTANYEAHNPVALLTGKKYPGLAGWFTAGQSDPQPLAAAQQLSALAKKTGHAGLLHHAPGRPLVRVLVGGVQGLAAVDVVAPGTDPAAEGRARPLQAPGPLIPWAHRPKPPSTRRHSGGRRRVDHNGELH